MSAAIDCGTGNFVAIDGDGIRIQRNAFLTIDRSVTTTKQLKKMKVPFVDMDNRLHIVGSKAYEYAQVFGTKDLKRPMRQGLLNPEEQDALPILRLIVGGLLKEPATKGEKVVYCVPAKPIDAERETDYHEDVLKQIIDSFGYDSRAINEGLALGNAGLEEDDLTGIAISMGAGMCLKGDTVIPLLDGRKLTIQELAESSEKSFWVYSCKKDGQIVPGKAYNAHKVKTTTKLLKIKLDNNEYLECTPDHKIMLRNGNFVEAQNLNIGSSLMPLYVYEEKTGYKQIKNNKTGMWNAEHRFLYKNYNNENLDKSDIVHHKDFNKRNNNPDNLVKMANAEHSQLHTELANGAKERLTGKTLEELYGEDKARKIKKTSSDTMKKSWKEKKIKSKPITKDNLKKCQENGFGTYERTTEHLKNISDTLYQKGQIPWNKGMSGKDYKKHFSNGFSNQIGTGFNHKVISIETINHEVDVYDMTVDEYHNFAIDSGIFVHNCNVAIMYMGMSALQFSVQQSGDWVDKNVSRDCGIPVAKAQYIKESGDYTIDPKSTEERTREQNAIKSYYEALIRYLLANISSQFESKEMPNFPSEVPIVIGGGSSMVNGFIEVFKAQFTQKNFPLKISEIRLVEEPLTAVARGCLIEAKLEDE